MYVCTYLHICMYIYTYMYVHYNARCSSGSKITHNNLEIISVSNYEQIDTLNNLFYFPRYR